MNRRLLFKRLFSTVAAVTFAAATECFGIVKLPSKTDDLFAQESEKMMDRICLSSWDQKGRISSLLEKGPIPDGLGFNWTPLR